MSNKIFPWAGVIIEILGFVFIITLPRGSGAVTETDLFQAAAGLLEILVGMFLTLLTVITSKD